MAELVALAARLTSGLLAGVFFVFAVAIMPALSGADDHTFEVSMNRINVSIVNPVFVLVFFGAPVLAVLAAVMVRAPLLYAAATLAVITLLITIAANIPLNNQLAAGAGRPGFEQVWVRWNVVRTVTGIGSFASLLASAGK